jgi:hypothetical protein
MIIDGIQIQSKEHLEEVISAMPEDSKVALRLIYDNLNK